MGAALRIVQANGKGKKKEKENREEGKEGRKSRRKKEHFLKGGAGKRRRETAATHPVKGLRNPPRDKHSSSRLEHGH